MTVNITNRSINGSGDFEQNPFAETTIIVLLLSFIFLLAVPTIFINLSLLVAFLKTGQIHKPLGVIHAALFVEVLLDKLSLTLILCLYYPPALRNCSCSRILSPIFFSSRVFISCYRPVMYVCLAISQLLIIKGKKRLVNYKATCGCLALGIVAGTAFATEAAVLLTVNDELFGCSNFCSGQDTEDMFGSNNIVFISYISIVWLPSFVLLSVSTIWSCLLFKKYSLGGNKQLNKRLISMPLILPAILVVSTVTTVLIRRLVFIVLQLFDLAYIDYWFFVSGAMITLVSGILDGVLYQLILTYLNPRLFSTWKMMFYSNISQVHPQN